MNEWINEWTNKWVNECMNTWMNESIQNEEHEWDMLHYQMLVYEHRCTCARPNTISLRSCTYVSNLAYSPVPTTAIDSPSTYICKVYDYTWMQFIYIPVYINTCIHIHTGIHTCTLNQGFKYHKVAVMGNCLVCYSIWELEIRRYSQG